MNMTPASARFVATLALILVALIITSAIGARYPRDWLLENVMVAAGVAYLAATFRRMPLSRTSYVFILIFLALHEVGAHWTFAEVPYDDAWRRLFGVTLNELLGWERNHYDRIVHFTYGLLITRPMRETLDHRLGLQGFASYFVTGMFILATASAYEHIEWAAALVFGGDLGIAYLGTQGDVWDSHKDTALAVFGSILALLAMAAGRKGKSADSGARAGGAP